MCDKGGKIKANLLNDFASKIIESTKQLQGQTKPYFKQDQYHLILWNISCFFLANINTTNEFELVGNKSVFY